MASSGHEDIESLDPQFVKFDRCIGCIEEIIISEKFLKIQHDFLTKYCIMFDDKEENKLIYTSIFQDYAQLAETYLEQNLKQMIPNFSMKEFSAEVNHQPTHDGEVFDMLREFIDFRSFKAMMIDFKTSKYGKLATQRLQDFARLTDELSDVSLIGHYCIQCLYTN